MECKTVCCYAVSALLMLKIIIGPIANICVGLTNLNDTNKSVTIYLTTSGVVTLALVIGLIISTAINNKFVLVTNTLILLFSFAWLIHGTNMYNSDCQPNNVCRYFKSQIILQYIVLLILCIWFIGGMCCETEHSTEDSVIVVCVTTIICVFVGFPISSIFVGAKFLDDCPKEPTIPKFLICLGILSLIIEATLTLQAKYGRTLPLLSVINGILTLSVLVWTLAGTVWFGKSLVVHQLNLNCNTTLYYYFISQLISVIVFASIMFGVFVFAMHSDKTEINIWPRCVFPEGTQYNVTPVSLINYILPKNKPEPPSVSLLCELCNTRPVEKFLSPCHHAICRNCGDQLLTTNKHCPWCLEIANKKSHSHQQTTLSGLSSSMSSTATCTTCTTCTACRDRHREDTSTVFDDGDSTCSSRLPVFLLPSFDNDVIPEQSRRTHYGSVD